MTSRTAGRAQPDPRGGMSDLGLALEDLSLDGIDDEFDQMGDDLGRNTFGQDVEHACR
jgi:hypothetical protein